MSLRIVFICAFLLMALSIANAESVSIPLKTVKKPSSDLLSGGQVLDVGQAALLAQKGQDLSLLNPQDDRLWQNQSYEAVDTASLNYPKGDVGVKFLSEEARNPFTYMVRVQSQENPNAFFRLTLSRYTHTTLMRAALLRKLGYYIPSPKYYKNLRLTFSSEEQKEEFLNTAEQSMTSDFTSRGWVIENNKSNHSVVFSDAVLEPSVSEYYDIQWGYAPNPKNPAQLPFVQRLSRYRPYRALIVPVALVDVPESINRYSAKFTSVLSGHIVINHPSAESFSACTYEDGKWLARRLQNLIKQDFEEVVRAGEFPEELNELVLAKLLYRVNNTLEVFGLKNTNLGALPSLNVTSVSGLVLNGKVTKEFAPGYPQRFAHGDRQSPFQDGDLGRYFNIQRSSMALGTVLNHLNKKLQLLGVEDALTKRRNDIQERIMNHIKTKPFEPLYQDVEAWGGPLSGFNVSATRHVTTGTYFGSSAPIQLVDNVSVAGSLGYFMTLDGVAYVSPMAGSNVMVMRDYTHVRPVLSIQEGKTVSWKDVVIPSFMNKLAGVLDQPSTPAEKSQDGVEKPAQDSLDKFLAELREGEVFTITDSISLSTYAQVSSSLDVLMGITPLSFINSVSVGGDAARAILRQTSFMRTADGIHVYVRSQKSKVFGLNFDLSYFVNVMRVRASTNSSDLHTDAFIIDYDPTLAEFIDSGRADQDFVKKYIETKKSLKPTLKSLFASNETELLYSKFKYNRFEIDHELKTKELRTKIFAMRISKLNEDHQVKIRYPRNPDAPELNPKDEEITLFANRKGELVGRDLLGFTFDWIEGILSKWAGKANVNLSKINDPNPANTPFGKAYWRTVTTESDLSVNTKQYPSVAVLQHVWGGWHLDRKDFLRLLDEVQRQLKGTQIASYRLIEPEAFANVTAVDFYRITASLSVLPGGLEKIRELILQPDANGKPVVKAKFLGRLFQKISQKMGHKARANDKEMFKDVVSMLGNGDYNNGLVKLKKQCQENRNPNDHDQTMDPGYWVNGSFYECMTPWVEKLLKLSATYPTDKKSQTRWMTDVLYVLDEQIPLPQLLKVLGEENYVFLVRINGFRAGDEDGDLEYFSNTLGDPRQNLEYANGLITMFANKTRVSPIELDRTQGGFR